MRILIVDDHELVRRGIRSLLAAEPTLTVCGEAVDGRDAVDRAKALRPDIVVMDISMPNMTGLQATREIRRFLPQAEIIIVSQHEGQEMVRNALDAGAHGYVVKSAVSTDLLAAIAKVSQRESFIKVPRILEELDSQEILQRSATLERALAEKRKQADRTTALLGAIVDSSDDAIISKNLNGVITSWNKGAERLFGYAAEEAIGQHITLIIPQDRLEEEKMILEKLSRGEQIEHFDTVRVRKNGTPVAISLTVSPVKDASGCVIGASKVARDVTERKQAEQSLAERALLLDLSNDAILVRDAADRVTYWNKSASELYGYTREEAFGRVTHDLLQTQFPEPLQRIFEKLHRHGRWTGELIHTRKNGSQIVVISRWAIDRDARGDTKCVLETNNDITQQKSGEKALRESENRLRTLTDTLESQVRIRTEQLEQRNREVLKQSAQLRELSHHLMQIQDEERRHIARELHDSAGQVLAALGINLATVLQHARNPSPKLAQVAEEGQELVTELSKEIRTMSYLLHPPLLDESGLSAALNWYLQGLKERSGLEITKAIPENFGRLSRELELAIFRIVQECLTNVHRHSGSKVAAIRLKRGNRSVFLEVEDAGSGISPERLLEIQSQGAGVGVRGMRERVLQFGGEMKIHSEGRGTKISITLPCGRTAPPGRRSSVQNAPRPRIALR
jgi:PAS domain S-box-containing protein